MRLIDADDLIFYGMTDDISQAQAEDIVANAPTIEAEPNSCEYWDSESHFCALRRPQAEPVRRGRWYIPKDYPSKTYRRICTACQDVAYYCGEGNYRYCPNCGAKMENDNE